MLDFGDAVRCGRPLSLNENTKPHIHDLIIKDHVSKSWVFNIFTRTVNDGILIANEM